MGVLVQANHGGNLRIAGSAVSTEIAAAQPPGTATAEPGEEPQEMGSIIIVIATDAPLLPHQLKRVAHRASHGLGRTGATSGNGSGDIAIAFSTANAERRGIETATVSMVSNGRISALFTATAEAVEEAIVNALITSQQSFRRTRTVRAISMIVFARSYGSTTDSSDRRSQEPADLLGSWWLVGDGGAWPTESSEFP